MSSSLRSQVINLYKNLLYYGKDYPLGYKYFRDRARKAFMKNKNCMDENEIKNLISRGEFVIKEVEALYKLKKYRTLKKNYYDIDNTESDLSKLINQITSGKYDTK